MKTETANFVYRFIPFATKECNGIKEDAEDLLQDLLIRMMPYASRFEKLPENEKKSYLLRAIRNFQKDRLRRAFSSKRDNSKNLLAKFQKPDAYSIIELKEVKKKATRNWNCKTLFMLAEGYSIKEISAVTGISRNNVLGTNHRARKFLKA